MAKILVRMKGLEPPLPCGNWNLNPARLPISPHPQMLHRKYTYHIHSELQELTAADFALSRSEFITENQG
jgi:hypothetical protein